jgi:hypothetical protein
LAVDILPLSALQAPLDLPSVDIAVFEEVNATAVHLVVPPLPSIDIPLLEIYDSVSIFLVVPHHPAVL